MELPKVDHAELVAECARHWLGAFVLATMPDYDMGWMHERICDELEDFLQAVIDRQSPRLMITCPPRSGKSQLASRHFPAYALGRYPDLSIIATSYSADLASRMNRDVQRIMSEESYARIFPESSLNEKNVRSTAQGSYLRNSDIFEIVGRRGVYRSAGVGGGVTGMGANICILDDVLKDRASADSPTIRQNIWDWYTSTLYTRLAPGGGIIVMNTRWHEDDLSGRLLDAQARGEGDVWRVVNFPAIAEVDEPPYRKKGEALHPARYPLEQLLKIKETIGSRDWEALYQQRPVPDGGAIFREEWLQRTWRPDELPERFDSLVIAFDMTFKGTSTSDYVVGQLFAKHGADFYLLDQERGHWSFTESLDAVRRLVSRAQAYTRYPVRVLVEDKANGPAVIDVLKKEIPGLVPIQPDGSKEARANAVTPLFEAGNVLLPDRAFAPWVDEYRLELLRFPAGAHDDQCFVAGTMIATPFGERPIEAIKTGDIVVTPFGCKKVLWSCATGEAEVRSNLDITATLKHPFIGKDGSIIPFEDIGGGEKCSKMNLKEMLTWRYRRLLCLTVSNTDAWVDAETITLASQKAMLAEGALRDFMLRFGNFTQGKQFLKAMKFIIRTAILLTTTMTTLSVCRVLTIARRLSKTLMSAVATLRASAPSSTLGIEAKRDVPGIESIHGQSSWSPRLKRFVRAAARCFLPRSVDAGSAPTPVAPDISAGLMPGRKPASANGAAKSLRPQSHTAEVAPGHAAVPVASTLQTQKCVRIEKVYNLTVKDCHLFYANGYLVHNCDATAYALRHLNSGRTLSIAPALKAKLNAPPIPGLRRW